MRIMRDAGAVFIEMDSDTLFIIGHVRHWRTGGIFVSDGAAGEIKPEWGREMFKQGEARMIEIALEAMLSIAQQDQAQQ
jgi:uridine phosphorylase